MQHIVEKWGFVYRGIITVDDGTPRLAYQRLLPTHVCLSLQHYVEHTVLPKYDSFDAAHNRSHALTVITAALAMAQANRVNPNIAYAAAAYHDTGLRHNREQHHLFSGQIIRADHNLRHWFSEQQIEIIAQAAEDHRASATTAPRSIYGCITAEADRHIDPRDIILRTVQYGRSHHPSLDKEGQWERVVHHLQEKYAEGGYLQLWLPDSPNAEGLRRLRAIIADHDALRAAFDEAYLHCLKSQP
ncbi:MAG: HD domain-containing protein [Bacteroidales bacterium]|nr:HD domain-containing protein [Bacteroidales bacterium]